jgi:hypothetical protein
VDWGDDHCTTEPLLRVVSRRTDDTGPAGLLGPSAFSTPASTEASGKSSSIAGFLLLKQCDLSPNSRHDGEISVPVHLIPSTEDHCAHLSTLVNRRLPLCKTGSFRSPSRNLHRSKEALKTDLERLVKYMAIPGNRYHKVLGKHVVTRDWRRSRASSCRGFPLAQGDLPWVPSDPQAGTGVDGLSLHSVPEFASCGSALRPRS